MMVLELTTGYLLLPTCFLPTPVGIFISAPQKRQALSSILPPFRLCCLWHNIFSTYQNKNMRVWLVCGCLYLLSCGTGPDDKASYTRATDSSFTHASELPVTNNDLNFAKDEQVTEELPATPPVKKPSGVYRFLLPEENGKKILHTVSFSTNTFRLQEEYSDKRDSIVVSQGTWAPSAGFIWLYRDQVVRGRYSWKGDTLQYYSPRLKKSFAMEKLTSVRVNNVWQTKKAEGATLYAVGTEPFWSVELTRQDSLVLNMPDWNAPLRLK
jgi:hypothetical protein